MQGRKDEKKYAECPPLITYVLIAGIVVAVVVFVVVVVVAVAVAVAVVVVLTRGCRPTPACWRW